MYAVRMATSRSGSGVDERDAQIRPVPGPHRGLPHRAVRDPEQP
jgi:hypothetical protein